MARLYPVQSPRGTTHLTNVGTVTLCSIPVSREWHRTQGNLGICRACRLARDMFRGGSNVDRTASSPQ